MIKINKKSIMGNIGSIQPDPPTPPVSTKKWVALGVSNGAVQGYNKVSTFCDLSMPIYGFFIPVNKSYATNKYFTWLETSLNPATESDYSRYTDNGLTNRDPSSSLVRDFRFNVKSGNVKWDRKGITSQVSYTTVGTYSNITVNNTQINGYLISFDLPLYLIQCQKATIPENLYILVDEDSVNKSFKWYY